MATRNDITGDLIKTKANGDKDAYADGWDRIFGKKDKAETHKILRQDTKWEGPPIDLASPETAADKPVDNAETFDEERQDIIGQNGNDGEHYNEQT